MSEIVYSEEQLRVIKTRGKNILVSAAAGSGKTTVLVERILQKITDDKVPVDIDRILVLTYTDAAAGEMRSRIEDAISKAIEADPDNDRLIRQAVLIHNAQISTIHGFCLSLIRNNFSDIGIDPSFRVAETGEVKLVEGQVAEDLIEELFESDDPSDIELLADRFASGNDLKGLKDMLLESYAVCRNSPFVREYIEERRSDYLCEGPESLFDTAWGRELKDHTEKILRETLELTEYNISMTQAPGGAFMYTDALRADADMIRRGLECESYSDLYSFLHELSYARLGSKKSTDVSEESKTASKHLRERVKKLLSSLADDCFVLPAHKVIEGMRANGKIVEALVNVLLLFDERLEAQKQYRKIIDFSDMEHYAVRILLKKQDGYYAPTRTALDYRDVYDEIMVDEYQDSNPVQEKILEAISAGNIGRYNRFMVGDVKQSIYSFRKACPELFMEKYDSYNSDPDNSVRIDLSANYRSRKETVDCVNHVFERLMGKDLGNITYDKDARLYAQAVFAETDEDHTPHLMMLEYDNDDEAGKQEQEARMVAEQIKKLVGSFMICDKDSVRPCGYRDIVIMLRTNKGWDDTFRKVLESYGIPTFTSSKTGYFSSVEIKNLLNLLCVLDNPRNEIRLYGVLTDVFGGFSDDEIALIRAVSKCELYDAVKDISAGTFAGQKELTAGIKDKCSRFMSFYAKYRKKIVYTPINELLEEIITQTGYMHHVASLPFGDQRRSNVYMLLEKARKYESGSFKGLYHFIRYIEAIQSYEIDYGEASMVDEQADVVRIMSIHKSKGLEFPVCFICGLGKQFNMMDLRSPMLFEKKLGIGMEYIDLAANVKYTDIRRRTLARKMKLDMISEEIRVLYVAMTRAKEKLIMTACVKDPHTLYDKSGIYRDMAKDDKCGLLPYSVRSGINSYLEALLYTADDDRVMPVDFMTVDDLDKNDVMDSISGKKRQSELVDLIETVDATANEDEIINAKNKIMFKYPHEDLAGLYTKTSVSELKIAAIHDKLTTGELEDVPAQFFTEHETEKYLPSFISAERKVSGTARGSAYHRVMELFDFSGCADLKEMAEEAREKKITRVIEDLVASGRLNREEADLVDAEKIRTFIMSELGVRMCNAAIRGELWIEQPFVLGIGADRLKKGFPKDETVLIQGIIDAYFYENDHIILMDYKTDSVADEKQLIERYKLQLDYYKEALERILGKKVEQKLIYSFALGKTIEL